MAKPMSAKSFFSRALQPGRTPSESAVMAWYGVSASSAAADYVVDWRVPQANDANANAWVADVVVPAGEKVVLEWTDYFAFHNVYRMKDKEAYDACDFEGAVELAPSAAIKRFGAVNRNAAEGVVDLHYQTVKSCWQVLDLVLPLAELLGSG